MCTQLHSDTWVTLNAGDPLVGWIAEQGLHRGAQGTQVNWFLGMGVQGSRASLTGTPAVLVLPCVMGAP